MKYRMRFVVILLWPLLLASVHGQTQDRSQWSTQWQLHWEEGTTDLTLNLGEEGRIVARTGDQRWTGTIIGRSIELEGSNDDTIQRRWIGWLTPSSGADAPAFFAGSLTSTDRDGRVTTSGWYAIQHSPTEIAQTSKPPGVPMTSPTASRAADINQPQENLKTRTITQPTQGPFEGRWESLDGTYIITRDGRRLTVTTPDNRIVRGRITGADSCVIGLRPGCCSGTFEDTGTLRWQDGSAWHKTP